ncbi:MAG: Na(+)-translocating NADH-quinone reductase subunit C [Methylococcales bacterium]|nr:Na(+)-translocating NADH-quinone reductase subunit C [Methylococcales bacterium]
MQKNSIAAVFRIILIICLICSFIVSSATVLLYSRQQENQRLHNVKNILIAADLYDEDEDFEKTFKEHIEPRIIELDTGERLLEDQFDDILNIDHFNFQTLANDPVHGENIAREIDIAKLNRQPRRMLVYFVKTQGQIDKLIIPVYGKGLWSTLYGYLALHKDLKTIAGITFYQHGETPGLGGEVDNPKWKQLWKGKLAFDDNGKVAIHVLRGSADPESIKARYQIDGLAGATLTSRGIDKLINYWLSENGYGPFLAGLQKEWLMDSR